MWLSGLLCEGEVILSYLVVPLSLSASCLLHSYSHKTYNVGRSFDTPTHTHCDLLTFTQTHTKIHCRKVTVVGCSSYITQCHTMCVSMEMMQMITNFHCYQVCILNDFFQQVCLYLNTTLGWFYECFGRGVQYILSVIIS